MVYRPYSMLEIAHHQNQPLIMASSKGTLAHLLPTGYEKMVASWLEEDCPSFDYGGFVVGENMAEARLLGKSPVGQIFSLIKCVLLLSDHCTCCCCYLTDLLVVFALIIWYFQGAD